jgi:hypothetical protein
MIMSKLIKMNMKMLKYKDFGKAQFKGINQSVIIITLDPGVSIVKIPG